MEQQTVIPKKYKRKYKCPFCEEKYDRERLSDHIEKKHKELIPEGYTATRVAFNTINNKEVGHCIMCGGESPWNENKKRYERLCNKPACHKAYLALVDERLKKSRNQTKSEMLSDPQFQDKMLKGRNISGTYIWSDGKKIPYVGSYEKNFLEFMDKYLHINSTDIQAPGPVIEYYFDGKKHFWITDFYYAPYNLVLDIKDGGNNPNTRNMPIYRAKQDAKEKAIAQTKQYNYLRLTDNQFDQLLEMMLDLKDSLAELDGEYLQRLAKMNPVIKINESASVEIGLSTDLQRIFTNPYTYQSKDLSSLENIIKSQLEDNLPNDVNEWLGVTLNELQARMCEYDNYLKCGKCSYIWQPDCEMFKKHNITVEDILEVYNKLKDIKNIILSGLETLQDSIYEYFDYRYFVEYVI